jgi:hypothetical protein
LTHRALPFPILVNDDLSMRNTTSWVVNHRTHPEEYRYQDCPAMVQENEREFLASTPIIVMTGEVGCTKGVNVPHPCEKCGLFDHMTQECGMTGAVCRYCGEKNHLAIVCPLLRTVCSKCKTVVGHASECHKAEYGLDTSDLRDRARLYVDMGLLTQRLKDVNKAYEVKFGDGPLSRNTQQLCSLPRQVAMEKKWQRRTFKTCDSN